MDKQELQRLNTLKNIFPEESWPWAISALMRSPQIWDRLDSVEFSQLLVNGIGVEPSEWTPGRIGSIQGEQDSSEEISWPIDSFEDLSANIKQKVHQIYQESGEQPVSSGDLSEAFWLSLALWGEKASGKSWREIISQYLAKTNWEFPLVILLDLVNDQIDFLRVFDPDLAFQVLLSNPISPPVLADILVRIMESLEISDLEKWLKTIQKEVPDLSELIAQSLLEKLELDSSSLQELLVLSVLNQLAGKSETALELLELASDRNQKLQGKLSINLNKVRTKLVEPRANDRGWQELKSSISDQTGLGENIEDVAAIIRSLVEKEHLAAAGDLISKLPEPLPEHPDLYLALAEFARIQNQPLRAKQFAVDALEKSLVDPAPPEGLSKILHQLGLFGQSARAAQKYLEKYPNHLSSHLDNVEALRSLGNYADAAKAAQILTVLYPQEVDLQRKLADYLEEAEVWKEALEIRSKVLSKMQLAKETQAGLEPYLPLEDLKLFANCALKAGQPNRAISACNQILAQDPENSRALSFKGKSLCVLDQIDEGLAHLNRAVELNPDIEETWINLAECHLEANSDGQALQILKSGLTSTSSRAKILMMIGHIETKNHNHSKALEKYQQAAASAGTEGLHQKSIYEIQLGEGLSYYELGHHDQARNILKELNERFPGNSRANYIYGKLLLETGDAQGALPYFVQIVDQDPTEAEPYLYYADALLRVGGNTESAIIALGKALTVDPANEIALVLLAEAKIASGNHKEALNNFQKARESSLQNDPTWAPRISAGLGKTALALGEIETAIASLKDGQDRYPRDLNLTKTLAEAYQAGDLTSNALDTARKAAEIAPQDPDNLAWVAEFTLGLGSPEEGISALKKLIRLNPGKVSSHLLLGKAQASAGDENGAVESLMEISELEDTLPADLLTAGNVLIQLGHYRKGLKSLAKAINICGANPEPSPLLPKIWSAQSAAYEMADDPQKALELLDQAISAELDRPEWRIQKADLLIRQDRYQAAIASLSNALDLSPEEPALHTKMAGIQSQIASYEEAFHHAQEALTGYQNEPQPEPDKIGKALALAADLACATLRTDLAIKLLSSLDPSQIQQGNPLSKSDLNSYCLAAELALDHNQEVKAAEISNLLVSREADHPRVNILQARILNRQGNLQAALEIYKSAADRWHQVDLSEKSFSTAVELSLGITALELHCWKEAFSHFHHAAEVAPKEKRTLIGLTKFYIQRAETQRLTDTLKVINRSPGINSTSNEVYKSFLGCINGLSSLDVDPDLVSGLLIRGKAVFTPNQGSADALKEISKTPEEIAAVIGAYRSCRQMVFASQIAMENLNQLGEDSRLDTQINLALLRSKPKSAFKAASSALEAARRSNDPQVPIYFVGLALAAKRVDDSETAEESINKALQFWDDEPHWYALAAEMTADYSRAIEYYQKAIELEPEYGGHFLAMGKRHLRAKQALSAVKSFEKAISINPDRVDAWIQRALGKQALHKMTEALYSVNQAIALAPEHKEARKTAALLTFENGSYRESEKHLVSLLGQDPHDTDLLVLFAKTLTAQKQYDHAFRVIDKAISLEDESLELELQRASMIKQVEGPSAAIDELRIIGSRYPDRYPLVVELVSTLSEAGEIEQAIRTAQDVLVSEENGHSRDQKAHLYLLTGRLLRKSGQLDQAVHHLHKANKLVDPNYLAVLELGRVHQDRRQYEKALEQIDRAISIAPDESEGYYQAGRVLKDLKRFDQAERMLRQASKLAPYDLKIHRQLGVVVTLNLVHGDSRKEVRV